jgi:hypothetical protein
MASMIRASRMDSEGDVMSMRRQPRMAEEAADSCCDADAAAVADEAKAASQQRMLADEVATDAVIEFVAAAAECASASRVSD